MPSSTQLKLLLLLVGTVAAAVLVAHGGAVSDAKTLLHEVLGTSTVVSLGLVVFDRWVWAWSWLQPWLVKRPDVRGTWRGVLRSRYEPTPGEKLPDIPIYLCVKQTLTAIHVTMHSAESTSRTTGCVLETSADGHRRMGVLYFNEPDLHVRTRSSPHYGALMIDLVDDPVCGLRGTYWTDRGTAGTVELDAHDSHLFDTFSHAKEGRFTVYEKNPGRSWWKIWLPRKRKKRAKPA